MAIIALIIGILPLSFEKYTLESMFCKEYPTIPAEKQKSAVDVILIENSSNLLPPYIKAISSRLSDITPRHRGTTKNKVESIVVFTV